MFLDRVSQTTDTTGTGDIALQSPPTGYRSFTAFGDGVQAAYAISHPTLNEWEVGIGTVHTAGPTMTRTTVLASSNANTLVNFSAGKKTVINTLPAGLAEMSIQSAAIKLGVNTIGMYGATPITRRAGAAQAAVATTAPTDSSPWGFATSAQAADLIALVNELRAALVAIGMIKGSA